MAKTTAIKTSEKPNELNKIITIVTRRTNGRLRVQHDFSNCPTLTEQHSGHLTDINYLMSKYQPDELAAYIAAKNAHRQEILNHDFSVEPSLQDAQNVIYQMKRNFEALPDDIKIHFKNHVEFLKFIDNPANQEKMIKLGIMTKKEIDSVSTPTPTPPTTQEETKEKAK